MRGARMAVVMLLLSACVTPLDDDFQSRGGGPTDEKAALLAEGDGSQSRGAGPSAAACRGRGAVAGPRAPGGVHDVEVRAVHGISGAAVAGVPVVAFLAPAPAELGLLDLDPFFNDCVVAAATTDADGVARFVLPTGTLWFGHDHGHGAYTTEVVGAHVQGPGAWELVLFPALLEVRWDGTFIADDPQGTTVTEVRNVTWTGPRVQEVLERIQTFAATLAIEWENEASWADLYAGFAVVDGPVLTDDFFNTDQADQKGLQAEETFDAWIDLARAACRWQGDGLVLVAWDPGAARAAAPGLPFTVTFSTEMKGPYQFMAHDECPAEGLRVGDAAASAQACPAVEALREPDGSLPKLGLAVTVHDAWNRAPVGGQPVYAVIGLGPGLVRASDYDPTTNVCSVARATTDDDGRAHLTVPGIEVTVVAPGAGTYTQETVPVPPELAHADVKVWPRRITTHWQADHAAVDPLGQSMTQVRNTTLFGAGQAEALERLGALSSTLSWEHSTFWADLHLGLAAGDGAMFTDGDANVVQTGPGAHDEHDPSQWAALSGHACDVLRDGLALVVYDPGPAMAPGATVPGAPGGMPFTWRLDLGFVGPTEPGGRLRCGGSE